MLFLVRTVVNPATPTTAHRPLLALPSMYRTALIFDILHLAFVFPALAHQRRYHPLLATSLRNLHRDERGMQSTYEWEEGEEDLPEGGGCSELCQLLVCAGAGLAEGALKY